MALPLLLRNLNKTQGYVKLAPRFFTSIPTTRLVTRIEPKVNSLLPRTNLLTRNISLSEKRMSGHGDHSKLWPVEKAVSVLLLFGVPAAIAVPNYLLDQLLAVAIVMHFHWGLEACVADYVRAAIFGPAIPKLTMGLLYIISITTLGAWLYYNTNSIGLSKTIRKFWAIKQ